MTPERDAPWSALVGDLDSMAVVTAREPYGLIVSLRRPDDTPRHVEIVMTPDEWGDLVSISFGDIEAALQYVRDLVLEQPRDQRYLTYGTYDLVPSSTAQLPTDPGLLHLQALARQHPGGVIPGGGWWANPPNDH